MLDTLFMKLLDMTASGSIVILAVLLIRLFLRKAPKVFSYALWAVVLFRLICPVSIVLPVGVLPELTPVAQQYTLEEQPITAVDAGIAAYRAVGDALNGGLGVQHIYIAENDGEGNRQTVTAAWWEVWILFGQYLWITGMAGLAVYGVIAWLRLRKRLVGAVCLRENIYLADNIDTPFVLGLPRPRIYLPSSLKECEQSYVIAHEQQHIRRFDHGIKLLAFVALSLHWFNPLVWVAYLLSCRDMEMSCDEAVIKRLGVDIRADYAQSLLNLSGSGRRIGIVPLAFGEENTEERIRNLSRWKKPTLWLTVVTAIAVGIVSMLLLADSAAVDDQLSVFIDCQIADRYQTKDTQGRASCVDWEFLGKQRNGKETTVYIWMLYEEYAMESGQLQQKTGSHIPTAITVTKQEGRYRLVEYWEPRDGEYNPIDIRAKFPWYLRGSAMDSQRYYPSQHDRCLKAAREYFEAETAPQPGGTSAQEAFGSSLTYAGYTAEAEFIGASCNALALAQSDTRHLPVYKFVTREELDAFTDSFGKYLTLDQSYEEVPSFRAVAQRYDEAFFRENALVLVYIRSSDSSRRYSVHGVLSGGNQFLVRVKTVKDGQENRPGLAGWFLTVGVPQSMLSGITRFDADLDSAEVLQTVDVPWISEVESSELGTNCQIQAALPVTDLSSMSKTAKNAVDAEWNTYDRMTPWERQISSHLFGCVAIRSESWDQLQRDIGLPLCDPFSEISWLTPADIYGGISTDPTVPHIETTLLALESMQRQIGQVHVTAGYKTEDLRVVLGVTLWNTGGIYTTLLARQGPADSYRGQQATGSGIPVLLTATAEDASYCDLTAWWLQDSALFSLRLVGEEESLIHQTMDKLLREI